MNEKKTTSVKPNNKPPDMLTINTLYSFTLNPDDKHQYYGEPERLYKCMVFVKKLLDKQSFEYHVWPEISTPKNSLKTPRVHFHGFIKFINSMQIAKWYNQIHNQLAKVSYFDIDLANDPEIYHQYSQKNFKLMDAICHYIGIDYNEFVSLNYDPDNML